jgi:hypothetical protein
MTNELSITAIMWFVLCGLVLGQMALIVAVRRGLHPPATPVTINVVAGSAENVLQAGSIDSAGVFSSVFGAERVE